MQTKKVYHAKRKGSFEMSEDFKMSEEIMATSYKLSKLPNHKNPFDRLIV